MKMHSILICFLAGLLLCSISSGESLPGRPREGNLKGGSDSWPLVMLELSEKATLKELFDSGLRPYRFPAMETGLLEAKHFRVSVKIGENHELPVFPVEYANIGVVETGEIISLHFTTPQLSLPDSRDTMVKWLGFSDNNENDLEFFFNVVRDNPQFWRTQSKDEFVSRGFLIVWDSAKSLKNGKKIPSSISFKPTFSESNPLRIRLGFSWALNFPLSGPRNYRVPIPPPPGYEHVSMQAPKNFGPDMPSQASIDARMAELIKERGLEPIEEQKTKKYGRVRSEEPTSSRVGANGTSEPERRSSRLPWIIAGVLLVGILVLLLKAFKGKSTR